MLKWAKEGYGPPHALELDLLYDTSLSKGDASVTGGMAGPGPCMRPPPSPPPPLGFER